MMNTSAYNTANVVHQEHNNVVSHAQQTQQQHQHVANLLQSSPPVTTTTLGYLQQSPPQQQQQHHHLQPQQLPIFDPRQLHAVNGLEKATHYYMGSAGNAGAPPARYYTTTAAATTTSPPQAALPPHANTILITNNFAQQQFTAQQQQQQQQRALSTAANYNNNSIRIVSSAAAANPPHVYNQQQHVYNQQAHHMPASLLPQHFAPTQQHFAAQLQLPPAPQQFYMPTDAIATNSSNKLLPVTPLSALAPPTLPPPTSTTTNAVNVSEPTTNSAATVVLDRINICINNHYTDATSSSGVGNASTLCNMTQQQPSPIIPAIQHKAVIDDLIMDAFTNNDSNSALVIDEPDSTTTTPHTPPTTPENSSPTSMGTTLTTPPSPSSSEKHNNNHAPSTTVPKLATKHSFNQAAAIVDAIIVIPDDNEPEEQATPEASYTQENHNSSDMDIIEALPETPIVVATTMLTPPSPPSPPKPATPPPPPPQALFDIGEDVFVRRQDERLYLGTIIDNARQQFLVRFDDKSELWCAADEMRKFGVSTSTTTSSTVDDVPTQMCVACKRTHVQDTVEICERCGRGYHRSCTTETAPGSDNWFCKRCAKPMKLTLKITNCNQLPYHVESLKWDDKHRVNEEQIYCYCGNSGKFDDNMLQCCKCKNWFHTHCTQCFKNTILRGDGFFVFCCSVCNDGVEFIRRLQMNWVDLLHLTFYNLAALKKHQHHKYHHLLKDVWPYILEKRSMLPLPRAWIEMPEAKLMGRVTRTLNDNADRFVCGREAKRDQYYYALRVIGPPILPKVNVALDDVLSDELLVQKLKLTLWKEDVEYNKKVAKENKFSALNVESEKDNKADIYEFRIEDDEKFTSDDEIPIKHIIDKVKRCQKIKLPSCTPIIATTDKVRKADKFNLDNDDENANDANSSAICNTKKSTLKVEIKKQHGSSPKKSSSDGKDTKEFHKPQATTHAVEKSSRKRKAFTLSKSYKEIAAEAAAKRYDCSRICDSSSDENSSSSRGTSLDVIIPVPKNFLGLNNPFRMVTPKKGGDGGMRKSVSFVGGGGGGGGGGNGCISGAVIKNSIFNTTALDFSSKLAALKSAGIFPNLSTSELAKAAGQPRTVRTIKRRLSAKDITIGPNQEVRRRRTRRLSSNIEVISTTTINPIPSNIFPIHAKDLLTHTALHHTIHHRLQHQHIQTHIHQHTSAISATSSASSSPPASTTSSIDSLPIIAKLEPPPAKPTHGRRLRQRPQKLSPANSRRSSISGASTSSNQSHLSTAQHIAQSAPSTSTMQDLKQSVNKYFGAVNRIESGEQFSIRAKRQLTNGQMQYLIEWGDAVSTAGAASNAVSSTTNAVIAADNGA